MVKKTLKLKKPDAISSAPIQSAPSIAVHGGAPAASLYGATVAGPSVSYTVPAIAGLIAIALLGVLLALQLIENSDYKSVVPGSNGVAAMPFQ